MEVASFNILESRWHLLTETLLLVAILAAAWVWPRASSRGVISRIEDWLVKLSERPWLVAFLVGALAVGLRAALLPAVGVPAPYIGDEFSILLQGQTFALGALSMPTHPLHPFFETYYVNQVPAYASMYFPGRGLPLALGILLFGSPWLGVWLAMVALCASVPWMLRAWVSTPLALVGGVLVVLKFAVLSGWVNSYYGGAFPALGGVLVLGAVPRLLRQPRWHDGIALGAGLFILMISRPFEGMLFALPFGIVLLWSLVRRLNAREVTKAARIGMPAVLLVGAGILLMLANNVATTGTMLKDPYSLNRATHAVAPPFLFQDRIVPTQSLPRNMVRGYEAEAEPHAYRNSLRGLVVKAVLTVRRAVEFYLGALLVIPFLVGLYVMRRDVAVVASISLLSLGIVVNTWDWSHYWAPGFGLFIIFVMKGFGRMREWRFRSREPGLFLSRALPLATVAMLLIPSAALYAGAPRPQQEQFFRSCCLVETETNRSRIVDQLQESPGKDLVLVRHRPDERPFMTLVANEPRIDEAEIVWAHDLGPATQRLLDYYSDRNVWRVEGAADQRAVRVRPALTRP